MTSTPTSPTPNPGTTSDVAPARKKVTVPDLMSWKAQGRRISMITAYDFTFAHLVDEAGIDVILVGDSVGMGAGNRQHHPGGYGRHDLPRAFCFPSAHQGSGGWGSSFRLLPSKPRTSRTVIN